MATDLSKDQLINEALAQARDRARKLGVLKEEPPSLAEFVEKTSDFKLHEWQRDYLCPILESLVHSRGRRILIHASPRSGKSTCVSMRFPAWAQGVNPEIPIIVAACNVSLATEFTSINRDLMASDIYKEIFPADACRIPPIGTAGSKEDAFSTAARKALGDGRPSIRGLGLQNAFVGKGAEGTDKYPGILIIDDPYASWDEAHNEKANNTVWRWWVHNARIRLNDDSNVLVMFHRFHLDDFTARLIAQPGSKWEYYRFPALAETEEEAADKEAGYDPTVIKKERIPGGSIKFPVGAWKRNEGDPLCSTQSKELLEEIKDSDPLTWWGMFMGRPRNPTGTHIQRDYLVEMDEGSMPRISLWVRAWDLTACLENKTSDYVAGALVGIGPDGTLYVKDIKRIRKSWPITQDLIIQTAIEDLEWCNELGARYTAESKTEVPTPTLEVAIEKVAWQNGMIQDLLEFEIFDQSKGGVGFWPIVPEKKKLARALGWIARAKNNQLRLIKGPWIPAFVSEALAFDGNDGVGHDDQIDAISLAYNTLRKQSGELLNEQKQPPPIGSIAYFRERAKEKQREQEINEYNG